MHFFFLPNAKSKASLVAAIALMISLVSFALWQVQPSAPSAPPSKANTPAQFSLAPAVAQLTQITQERHPIGSAAHDTVRDYLINEIKSLGLSPQVQDTFATFPKWGATGQVQNIVVRIAGRNAHTNGKAKALLLTAHYDSRENSFGAGDDGVSVISILQTLRLLKTQAPLENDLICVLTDGEEAGLLGANGFAEEHPWMKEVGMVLNFDNRGNAGPVLMFEPSVGNGKLIAGLAQAVKSPVTNSMMYEVYKALPNDTDFSVFRRTGVPGLNFALIENLSSYHTRYDRGDLISAASQQQQGEMMLSLVLYFGNQDLSQLQGEDHVYFSLPIFGLVHYPVSLALPIAGLLTLLAIYAFYLERKNKGVRLLPVLSASLLFLFQIGGIAFLMQQGWNLAGRFNPDYLKMIDPDTSHFYLLALLLLCATLFGLTQKFFYRWIRPLELSFGAVVVWLALLIFTSLSYPGASFLFAWPLLFVLCSWCVLHFIRDEKENKKIWILVSGAAFGIILFSPLIRLFNIALGFHVLAAPVILSLLLLGIFTPIMHLILETLRSRVFFIASIVFITLAAISTASFHQEFPVSTQLMYVSLPQTNSHFWMSPHATLDRTKLTVFSEQATQKSMPEIFGKNTHRKYWVEQAPSAGFEPPTIILKADQEVGDHREITLHIQSPEKAANTHVEIEGVNVLKANLHGKELSVEGKRGKKLSLKENETWDTMVYAMPSSGVDLRFTIAKRSTEETFTVRVSDTFYTLSLANNKLSIPPASKVDFFASVVSDLKMK
jgi:hypothetical protein